MNCKRCHHTDIIHAESDDSESLMELGACQIPDCSCHEYLDEIEKIDEEML